MSEHGLRAIRNTGDLPSVLVSSAAMSTGMATSNRAQILASRPETNSNAYGKA
jgi:hypothetical protein